MDEAGRFYEQESRARSTHLALRWKGRVRYTVPREAAGQQACWTVFKPGSLEWPLRVLAHLPCAFGSINCSEGDAIASMREAIGADAGLSCCRTGAEGVWSKDTILFLDEKLFTPLYIVKAGTGKAVDALLDNEAQWLRRLRGHASLVAHIPELVAHRPGTDICFVGQRALRGNIDFRLGTAQFDFLLKLQGVSAQSMHYENSKLHATLTSRVADLQGHVDEAWSRRLNAGVKRVEEALSALPVWFVSAHKDFTPWNVRIEKGIAKVFDWEFADEEQLPLFDALHFALTPMALKNQTRERIVKGISSTVAQCRTVFQGHFCFEGEIQALAYLLSVCLFYLSSVQGKYDSHPVLDNYALVIDHLCAS